MVRYGQKYARQRQNMARGVPLVATRGTGALKVLLILSHAKTEVGRVLVSTARVSEERTLDFVIFENGFGWERAQWNRILLSGGSNFEPNDAYKSLYQLYKEGIQKNKYVIYRVWSVRMGKNVPLVLIRIWWAVTCNNSLLVRKTIGLFRFQRTLSLSQGQVV